MSITPGSPDQSQGEVKTWVNSLRNLTGGYSWQNSAGNGSTGLSASSGDVITNTGIITDGQGGIDYHFTDEPNEPGANGAGVYLNGATLINAGTIAGGTNIFGQSDAVAFGATAATLVVESGAATDILSGAVVTLAGTLAGAVVNDGTIDTANGTSLTFASALTGTGVIIAAA